MIQFCGLGCVTIFRMVILLELSPESEAVLRIRSHIKKDDFFLTSETI